MANNLMTLRAHCDHILQKLPTRMDLNEESRTFLGEVAQGLLTRIEPLEKRARKINDDPRLTLEGKQDQFVELAKSAAHVVEPLVEQHKRVFDARLVLTHRVYPAPPVLTGTEAILQRMDFQEIRDAYRDKSQSERDSLYLQALQQNRPHIAQALLSAPTGSMITPEIVERAKVEDAKRRDPENFERLLIKGRLLDEMKALLQHALQAVDNLKGYKNNL